MDYHFVNSSRTTSKPRKYGILPFIPLFVLAAALPFLLVFAMSPSTLRFTTQADEQAELRVWLEPSRVISSSNKDVELVVKASFDSSSALIPTLSFNLDAGGLVADTQILTYPKPFRGEVTVGKVVVKAPRPGTYTVSIPNTSVVIAPAVLDINILTGSSEILVK